eukprot:269784-Chlamydomonas_euryale.AAC.4
MIARSVALALFCPRMVGGAIVDHAATVWVHLAPPLRPSGFDASARRRTRAVAAAVPAGIARAARGAR